jgi:anti-sigma factor RsiW
MEDMDCQDLVELVTAYLEDDMDPDARARFDTHLGECPGCATYLEQIEQTVHTLGALPPDELDPALRDRLLAAFRDWR